MTFYNKKSTTLCFLTTGAALGLLACSPKVGHIDTRFINADMQAAAGSQSQPLAAAGTAELSEIEHLDVAPSQILLCEQADISYYDQVADDGSSRTVDFVPDHCAQIVMKKDIAYNDLCSDGKDHEADYINLASPQSLAAANFQAELPPGDYNWVSLQLRPSMRVQASVQLRNDSGSTQHIYSKSCGHDACQSACFAREENISECQGTIRDPAVGSADGEVHPHTGDIWTPSPFAPEYTDPVDGSQLTSGHYWRRCQADMSQGPAQALWTIANKPQYAFKLHKTLTIPEGDGDYKLNLLFNLAGLVTGQAVAMDYSETDSSFKLQQFYGISDGFYGINIGHPALVPVVTTGDDKIWRYSYSVHVRADSAQPVCYADGFDAAPQVGEFGAAACHPCQGWEGKCAEGNRIIDGRVFSSVDMRPSQDFDLRVDLYYVASSADDRSDLRGASLVAYYIDGSPISAELPFLPAAVEQVKTSPRDGRMDLMIPRYHSLFPIVRQLPQLDAPGEQGLTIVELRQQPIAQEQSECAQCGDNCEQSICDKTRLFYQVPVSLDEIRQVGP